MRIETDRLILRQMSHDDAGSLYKFMSRVEVMYAWEHGFSMDEVIAWIDRRLAGYAKCGYDYLLAIDKLSGEVVGQAGLVASTIDDELMVEIGYVFDNRFWGMGYATEAARALISYAFNDLDIDKIVATIRPQNTSSIAVAKRLGMTQVSQYTKHYNGIDMLHYVYQITK